MSFMAASRLYPCITVVRNSWSFVYRLFMINAIISEFCTYVPG